MNSKELKKIILEEINNVLKEQQTPPATEQNKNLEIACGKISPTIINNAKKGLQLLNDRGGPFFSLMNTIKKALSDLEEEENAIFFKSEKPQKQFYQISRIIYEQITPLAALYYCPSIQSGVQDKSYGDRFIQEFVKKASFEIHSSGLARKYPDLNQINKQLEIMKEIFQLAPTDSNRIKYAMR